MWRGEEEWNGRRECVRLESAWLLLTYVVTLGGSKPLLQRLFFNDFAHINTNPKLNDTVRGHDDVRFFTGL